MNAIGDAAGPADLAHECVLFSDPEDLATQLGDLLAPSVGSDERIVAIVDDTCRSALASTLDVGSVEFLDPVEAHRAPAFTVAMRWARLSRRATPPGRRTTVVAQHLDVPGADAGHWIRLEAGLNVALAGLPVTMLCAFPREHGVPGAGGLPVSALQIAEATHPFLRVGGRRVPSDMLRDPVEIVAEYPPPPPPDLGTPAAEITFVAADLPALRRLVGRVAADARIDPERTGDLVLAANEIAANTVEHGPGSGVLRVWPGPHAVVVEVYDTGRLGVPFPGMVAPSPSGERGRGLWLASELTDVMQVWGDESGTVVRLHIDLRP